MSRLGFTSFTGCLGFAGYLTHRYVPIPDFSSNGHWEPWVEQCEGPKTQAQMENAIRRQRLSDYQVHMTREGIRYERVERQAEMFLPTRLA